MPYRQSDSLCAQEIVIGQHRLTLLLPENRHASLSAAVSGDGVDPYWGKLWGSATDSADCLLRSNLPAGATALEVGCGAGLLGIAGLMCGLKVTFSDHEPKAVQLAAKNARLNGLSEFETIVLDWNQPVDQQFDFIVASDVLYQESSHELILNLAAKMLAANGKLMIGDPGRMLVRKFLDQASGLNWRFKLYSKQMKEVLVPASGEFVWIVGKNES